MMQEKQVGIPDSTCLREEKKKKNCFAGKGTGRKWEEGKKEEVTILTALVPPYQATCIWLPQMKVTALSRTSLLCDSNSSFLSLSL